MKYLLSILAVLALAGTGCAQISTKPTTEIKTGTQMEESADKNKDTTMEINETEDGLTFIDEQNNAKENNTFDMEEGVETEADFESKADEKDVPVTEIVLGGKPDITVNMESGNFFFSPSTIHASPGDRVLVNFDKNSGIHTFVIDELSVDFSISKGESYTFTVPDEPGQYAYYCSIGTHRAFGMEGTLIVE